jgi:hypothetical protein
MDTPVIASTRSGYWICGSLSVMGCRKPVITSAVTLWLLGVIGGLGVNGRHHEKVSSASETGNTVLDLSGNIKGL